MPTGRVKVFHDDRNFGFITADDGREFFVSSDEVGDDGLRSGDQVEFEEAEDDEPRGEPRAISVAVTKRAPDDNPVGRTMNPPPPWDELQELERQRRMARRRRR
ncbi:MAG: cold shock domain-containing protein [Nitriliruptorales bacterium]|nr:cold shock domain-containing protein [Nitriliruptorales bacterium]